MYIIIWLSASCLRMIFVDINIVGIYTAQSVVFPWLISNKIYCVFYIIFLPLDKYVLHFGSRITHLEEFCILVCLMYISMPNI